MALWPSTQTDQADTTAPVLSLRPLEGIGLGRAVLTEIGRLKRLIPICTDRPGGLAGHSAALIGFRVSVRLALWKPPPTREARRALNLGYAEIAGSEPAPATLFPVTDMAWRAFRAHLGLAIVDYCRPHATCLNWWVDIRRKPQLLVVTDRSLKPLTSARR